MLRISNLFAENREWRPVHLVLMKADMEDNWLARKGLDGGVLAVLYGRRITRKRGSIPATATFTARSAHTRAEPMVGD
jgi:hypothetical protein